MNDYKYLKLLQEQFDIDLSLPQRCALQGYLDGNAQAAQLAAQIQSVVENSDQLSVPEEYLPRDPEKLHKSIMESLETPKFELPSALKWIVLFFKKESRSQADSALLDRLKKRQPAPRSAAEISILEKGRVKPVAPLEPQHDSLAQLIQKRRLDLSRTFTTDETDDQPNAPRTVAQSYDGALGESAGRAADPDAWQTPFWPVEPQAAFAPQENLSRLIPVDEISSAIDALFVDAPRVPPIELPPDQVTHAPIELADEAQIHQDEIDRRRSTFARLNINEHPQGKGQITSLGKFLLDPKCEKMIESMISGSNRKLTTKVLTEQESIDLKECLRPIGDQDGVAGCVVLGYDGFVIANTLPAGCDLDVFSAWALVTYISSNNAVDFIGHGRVHQIVSRTFGGIILLADFGQGLLVAVSDKSSTEAVLPLMRGARKISAA